MNCIYCHQQTTRAHQTVISNRLLCLSCDVAYYVINDRIRSIGLEIPSYYKTGLLSKYVYNKCIINIEPGQDNFLPIIVFYLKDQNVYKVFDLMWIFPQNYKQKLKSVTKLNLFT